MPTVFIVCAVALSFILGFIAGRSSRHSGPMSNESTWSQSSRAASSSPDAQDVLTGLTPQQRSEIEALVGQGKKIEAIKQLRTYLSLGLGEAKGIVDRIS